MSLPLLSFGSPPSGSDEGGVVGGRRVVVAGKDMASSQRPVSASADRALLARIQEGDDDAFASLFHEHYDAVCDYAARFVRDSAVAEDLAQEVFARVLERRYTIQVETTWRGYLIRAVRREALHHLRHGQVVVRHAARAAEGDAPFQLPSAEDWVANAEISALVETAAGALPPRVQEAFLLRWRYELRYEEIASAMDLSVKTVEMHLTRALKAIRAALAEYVGRTDGPEGHTG